MLITLKGLFSPMRVLLQSIGSRGDVEPFLAMGLLLKDQGADVAFQFPEQFREDVEKLGQTFYGLDRNFLKLLQSQVGKSVMGGQGGFWKRTSNMVKLARKSIEIQKVLLDQQLQVIRDFAPNKIIYHPKCVMPLIWELAHPDSTLLASPVPCVLHPDHRWSTLTVRGNGDYGAFINKLSYRLVNLVRLIFFKRFTKRFQQEFPQINIRFSTLKKAMLTTPAIYPLSPTLFPPNPNWPSHIQVTGYFERRQDPFWQPEPGLVKFLESNPEALLITFGSMTNSEPELKTKAILDTLDNLNIPAILNTSWGGLIKTTDSTSSLQFIDYAPYSWIIPRVRAVVHHGGAGTTHATCKYGKPSLIIPHIADQFFWNRRINELGLGPLGIFIKKLNTLTLEPLMKDLYHNPGYYQRAQKVQRQMNKEDGKSKLYEMIELTPV